MLLKGYLLINCYSDILPINNFNKDLIFLINIKYINYIQNFITYYLNYIDLRN